MVAIVNVGENKDGTHSYEVRINRMFVTTFNHRRDDGLAKCFYLASEAVAERNREDALEFIRRVAEVNL